MVILQIELSAIIVVHYLNYNIVRIKNKKVGTYMMMKSKINHHCKTNYIMG